MLNCNKIRHCICPAALLKLVTRRKVLNAVLGKKPAQVLSTCVGDNNVYEPETFSF